MLFNSYTFLGFYAVVLVAYFAVAAVPRAQNVLLLVASYAFYAAWDVRFLPLILLSTAVDYVAARRLEGLAGDGPPADGSRRAWLGASLLTNLGVLGLFKYYGFAVESFRELASWVGLSLSVPVAEIVLPVGISFYTFQTLSYTIDVYRGRIHAERDPLDFALFVAFFPQLVAGPIERASHFLPQIKRRRRVRAIDCRIGIQFVLLGYFFKVVLADSVAPLVDQVFARPQDHAGGVVWCGVIGFAVQIYGDFLGYSLIARGVSRWMGFRLVSNFRQPYLASSPRDFWHRWHRSLSHWLRRYLYFELGGNRGGMGRTARNLMITMLLGGLWHGAAWNFVLWGGYHGALLVGEHVWRRSRRFAPLRPMRPRGPLARALGRGLRVAATATLVLIGWVLFRGESLGSIGVILVRLVTLPGGTAELLPYAAPVGAAAVAILAHDLWRERSRSSLVLLRAPLPLRWGVDAFLLFSILAVGFRPAEFLYFQF